MRTLEKPGLGVSACNLAEFSGPVRDFSTAGAGPVSLYFEEMDNEAGIVIHAVNQDGDAFTSGLIAGETASAGNLIGCTNFACDLSIVHAGFGKVPSGTAFVMLENDGVTVSDMLVQVGSSNQDIVWQFFSDPSLFPTSVNIVGSVVENGQQQLLGTYINDQTFLVSLYARSDISETPLPAALPLFATGLGALGMLGWRRKRKNAAARAAA